MTPHEEAFVRAARREQIARHEQEPTFIRSEDTDDAEDDADSDIIDIRDNHDLILIVTPNGIINLIRNTRVIARSLEQLDALRAFLNRPDVRATLDDVR